MPPMGAFVFCAEREGLFHEPFWGSSGSKAMPLRGNGFFCFEYSLEPAERGIVLAALGHRMSPLQKTNAGALPLIIFHCCSFEK